ncbi:MAG: hypothetical protein LBT93_04030, partial [Treponema sp.]|nr:hypothetical protein [Treponema sp.]
MRLNKEGFKKILPLLALFWGALPAPGAEPAGAELPPESPAASDWAVLLPILSPQPAVPALVLPADSVPEGAPPERTPEYPAENFPLPPRPVRKTPYQRPPRLLPHGAFSPAPQAIPGLDAALTRHYISQYSSPGGIAWLQAIMNRAGPYMAFIRKELEERKLPAELIYLPVIE